jgi:N-carbamoyl-L-amino-acid hydrolase
MSVLALRPLAEKLFSDVRELSFDGIGVTRESYHG